MNKIEMIKRIREIAESDEGKGISIVKAKQIADWLEQEVGIILNDVPIPVGYSESEVIETKVVRLSSSIDIKNYEKALEQARDILKGIEKITEANNQHINLVDTCDDVMECIKNCNYEDAEENVIALVTMLKIKIDN